MAGNADVQNLFNVKVPSNVGGGELERKKWVRALKLLWDVARLKNQADLIVLVPEVAVVVPLEARVGRGAKPASPLIIRDDRVGGRVKGATDGVLANEGAVGEVAIALVGVAVRLVAKGVALQC